MVVYQRHCTLLVVTFYEHALRIEVREAEGTDDMCHAMGLAKLFHFGNQCRRDFLVVNGIEPAETDLIVLPVLISAIVDDSGNPSDGFSILVCHIQYHVTEIRSRIPGRIQSVHFIENKIGDIVRIMAVQFFGKKDELTEFSFIFGINLPDFQTHNYSVSVHNSANLCFFEENSNINC